MSDLATPSAKEVLAVMQQVSSPQLRRVFFDGLDNPNWVRPLLRAKQFNPPEPVTDDEGYIRERPWPEIDYLARMAPVATDDVIAVFLALKKSRNSWFRRAVIEVASSLPVEQAARLKPLFEEWEADGYGYRTDPEHLATLTRNLLQGPKPAIGRRLARALFRPNRLDQRGRPAALMEEYWYELELPSVVEALGDDALQQVVYWLQDWERLAGHLTDDGDHGWISRPTIAVATKGYHDVEEALIDATRDAAVEKMRRDPVGTTAVLLKSPLSLTKRILLHAAGQALASELVRATEIIDATIGVLDNPVFAEPSFRMELAEFIRALFVTVPERLAGLGDYLERGPLASTTNLAARLRRDGDSDAEVEERVHELTKRWRHRLLATVGRDFLPPAQQAMLDDLDKTDGVIEPAPDFQTSFWTGPDSPVSSDDMMALTAEQLAHHLETWRPEAGSRHGPSHEGQGRELTTILTTKPAALEGAVNIVDRLRPLYLRAMLHGWRAAIAGHETMNWDQIIEVVRGILGHADVSPYETDGDDFDDDADFTRAKQAAASLIEEAVKKRDDNRVPASVVDELGSVLLTTDMSSAWDEYVAMKPGEGFDPLTLSINARWPIQLRALIHFSASTGDPGVRQEALRHLDNELGRDDPFEAAAAVIGENLPRLYLTDEDWLRTRIDQLFGTAEAISKKQQIALSTALATQLIHSVTLNLLRGPITAAMRLDEPIAFGWKGLSAPEQLIGEWIITTHIRGQIGLDDSLMTDYFTTQSADVRGSAIGHIAWSFMHAEVVDDDIRRRLEDLWDARAQHVRETPDDNAELKDFFWFIRSGKFAESWWVPRLVVALQLDPRLPTRGMIGENLAAASARYPAQILDAVSRLAEPAGEDAEISKHDLMEHAAPAAIAAALPSKDGVLNAAARAFMNRLAEQGYIDIVERVQAAQNARAASGS